MVRAKTNKQNGTNTKNNIKNVKRKTFRINNFCVLIINYFLRFKIFLNQPSKKFLITALVQLMTFIGSLNQFKLCFNTR